MRPPRVRTPPRATSDQWLHAAKCTEVDVSALFSVFVPTIAFGPVWRRLIEDKVTGYSVRKEYIKAPVRRVVRIERMTVVRTSQGTASVVSEHEAAELNFVSNQPRNETTNAAPPARQRPSASRFLQVAAASTARGAPRSTRSQTASLRVRTAMPIAIPRIPNLHPRGRSRQIRAKSRMVGMTTR